MIKIAVITLAVLAALAIAVCVLDACALPPASAATVEHDAHTALHELCTLRRDQLALGLPDAPHVPPALYKRLDAACAALDTPAAETPASTPGTTCTGAVP